MTTENLMPDRRNLLLASATLAAASMLGSPDAGAQSSSLSPQPLPRAAPGTQGVLTGIVMYLLAEYDGRMKNMDWSKVPGAPDGAGIVHHTDSEREYAYDRPSKIGQLDKAWDEAKAKGWAVVDMKQDWKTVFPDKP